MAMTNGTELAGNGFHNSLSAHCFTYPASFPLFKWLCEKSSSKKSVDWHTEHVAKPLIGYGWFLSANQVHHHSAVAPFRCLAAMPPEWSTRAGILPACPSLDRTSRDADVGFEPRTFRGTIPEDASLLLPALQVHRHYATSAERTLSLPVRLIGSHSEPKHSLIVIEHHYVSSINQCRMKLAHFVRPTPARELLQCHQFQLRRRLYQFSLSPPTDVSVVSLRLTNSVHAKLLSCPLIDQSFESLFDAWYTAQNVLSSCGSCHAQSGVRHLFQPIDPGYNALSYHAGVSPCLHETKPHAVIVRDSLENTTIRVRVVNAYRKQDREQDDIHTMADKLNPLVNSLSVAVSRSPNTSCQQMTLSTMRHWLSRCFGHMMHAMSTIVTASETTLPCATVLGLDGGVVGSAFGWLAPDVLADDGVEEHSTHISTCAEMSWARGGLESRGLAQVSRYQAVTLRQVPERQHQRANCQN
ncbi:hypothetical protein CSKR_113960 [Clonorchis sinensis]|uniref:Uncharacterized protein n=1 Tax=Clonorchis sinensis TaxID=79923 RepID=A0A8T1MX63_CLOSI|nr:hypothetical protein CSKR_113960 [Clonorchis sinensis]